MKLHPRLGAVTAGTLALATLSTLFVGVGAAFAVDDGPVDAGITVNKIDGLPSDFINGVDVSSILSEEESGVVFHDFAGNVADPFDVLAEAGINYVRVRVWNDPYNSTTHLGYGAGNTDAARATEIGERATAAGLKVLVDFHYSDFWADPGKQKAPKAWASMTLEQKAVATHDYTAATLQGMKDAGVDVGMVQIGNETNGAVAGVTGIPNMASIFSAGSAAVREVFPSALVALHFTNPETAGRYAGYASQLQTAGVDYDVFASSYYPYWHGTLANLTSVLSDIATTYGKKVMVAETSYANTLADGDGTANSVTSVAPATYPVSVQGQATEIRDVMDAVNSVSGNAGLGVFYWEPAWIPVPGATLADRQAKWAQFGSGWATTAAAEYDSGAPTANAEGSGWDNQALFDYNGNPLESLRAFAYARTGAVAPLAVVSVESPSVTFTQGDAVTLPSTVTVTYNDSSTAEKSVTWSDVLGLITSPGTYTVHGVVDGGSTTTATVTVKAVNYLVDGDFEQGNFQGWYQNGTTSWPDTFWVNAAGSNAYGDYAVNVYDDAAYSFTFQQRVSGLEPGDYTFEGLGQGADLSLQAYATTSSGTSTQTVALTGYLNWKAPGVTFTIPADGSVEVGIKGTGAAGGWGWLDNFELVKATTGAADTSALEALVDQANGLNRSVYSGESLANLDSALEVANIVLAASVPSLDQVSDASALVTDALAGLVIVGDVPDPTVTNPVVSVIDGSPVILPATAKVTFFDGRHEQQDVTWDDVLGWIDGPGTYTVHGVTSGGLAVVATVTVTERNWVVNGNLETGDLTGWSTSATNWPGTFWYSQDTASVHGTTAVNIYGASAYDFDLSQAITGVPAGTYRLEAQAHGGTDSGPITFDMALAATTSGGEVSVPVTVTGWGNWAPFGVDVSIPADGNVTVSLSGTGGATSWAFFDDFRFVAVANNADTSALDAAVAAANALDRSLYVPTSLESLDAALVAYDVLTGATDPSQASVDALTQAINDGLDELDLIDVAFTTAPTPTITGTANYGSTLTVSPGTWVPTPSGISYQWLRNGVNIASATGATYTPVYGDIGASITVTVTGSRADYLTTAKTSASVTIVKGVFTTQPAPRITGTPTAGHKLTAVVGAWSPRPAAFSYQWYRDGKAISGQRSTTYKVKSADVKHKITVTVTALKTGYTPASKTSAAVTIVKPFRSTGYASITGTAKVGKTLIGHRGIWSPTPSAYGFQWYRNGVAISGATHTTYKLTSADKGKKVTLKVTAKKSGYLSTSHTSRAVTVK